MKWKCLAPLCTPYVWPIEAYGPTCGSAVCPVRRPLWLQEYIWKQCCSGEKKKWRPLDCDKGMREPHLHLGSRMLISNSYMRQPSEIGNVQEWCQQSPGLMQLEERRDSFQDSRQMCDGLQGLKWGHRKRNWGLSANCSPDFPPNLTHLSPATAQGLTHTSSQKIARHSQNVWELPTSTSPPRPGQSLLSAFLN